MTLEHDDGGLTFLGVRPIFAASCSLWSVDGNLFYRGGRDERKEDKRSRGQLKLNVRVTLPTRARTLEGQHDTLPSFSDRPGLI